MCIELNYKLLERGKVLIGHASKVAIRRKTKQTRKLL
jgi:hypothetical protein